MDLFHNLPWKIKEPSVLDIGTDFVKEETIAQSYLFLNNFTPEPIEDEKPNPVPVREKKTGLSVRQQKKNNRYQKHSRLNVSQHKQCIKALQLLDSDQPLSSLSLQDQQVINIYNNLKILIYEENEEFLKFVEEDWTSKLSNRVGAVKKLFKNCGMRKRSKKFERIQEHPEFYTTLKMVPLSNNELPIHIEHGPCLLQLGSVYQLNIPDLEKNDEMRSHVLPPLNIEFSDQYLKPSIQCVSKDIYAECLAKNSHSNIVITMSSLKTIIDNYGPDYSNSWDIPVVVKKHEENGKKFYVAYVDKPFLQRHISLADIDYSVRKRLLKRFLRSKNNFSYPTPQFIKDLFDRNSNIEKTDNNVKTNEYIPEKKQSVTTDSPLSPTPTSDSESESLVMLESSEKVNDNLQNKQTASFCSGPTLMRDDEAHDDLVNKQAKEKTRTSENFMETHNSFPDLSIFVDETTDDLMNAEKKSEKEEKVEHVADEEPKIELKLNKNKNSKIYNNKEHNVSYRLWSLKAEDENVLMKNCVKRKAIKILVRAKSDGYLVQSNGASVSTNVVPKLEYQREHGAQVLTKSELLRQWTTLHFNPFSNLLRVRIFPNANKVMKVETLNLNKITHECLKKQNFNPKENLGILYNVLSALVNLEEEGNYILHHTPKEGPFGVLLKSDDGRTHNVDKLNLHELYEEENCSVISQIKWIPIDTTLVLPYHEQNGFMPGLFPPSCKQQTFSQNGSQRGRKRGKKWVQKK